MSSLTGRLADQAPYPSQAVTHEGPRRLSEGLSPNRPLPPTRIAR